MEIPRVFFGRKREPGAIERILKTDPQVPESKPSPVQASNLGIAKINPREYIQVGIDGLNGTPAVISAYELTGSNNMNYEDTHGFLLEKGLYMPTPKIFMTHFRNVRDAKMGSTTLNYADGTKVPDSDVENLYKHLTTNYGNVFGRSDVGVWTWLNAKFDKKNIETVMGINSKKELVIKSTPLESCLDEDCYVTFDFNPQGLPKSKSSNQNYSQGNNIYFWHPRQGQVAGFGAGAGGAGLGCYRLPSGSNTGLGVFATAEGRSQTKT